MPRKESENEREDPRTFELRREHFLRSRRPPEGLTVTQARTSALQSSARLGELSEATLELADTPPRRELELEAPEGHGSVTTAPELRFAPSGFVGEAAAVKLKESDGEEAILKIGLDADEQAGVVVETVRIFQVDGHDWRIVPRGNVARDGTHVWCLLSNGGVFAAAGVVRERSVIAALLASYALRIFLHPLFRERQSFSQAVKTVVKAKDWRALAKRSKLVLDDADAADVKTALDRLRRNLPAVSKIKSPRNGPVEWQILEMLSLTPEGQQLLDDLDILAERKRL